MGFLTVLLTILKIIGIVLASVVGLMILLLLVILLSPVSYRGRIKYDGQIDINLKVRYLFGIVRAYFIKNGDGQDMDARVLWLSLLKKKKRRGGAGGKGRRKKSPEEHFDYGSESGQNSEGSLIPDSVLEKPPEQVAANGAGPRGHEAANGAEPQRQEAANGAEPQGQETENDAQGHMSGNDAQGQNTSNGAELPESETGGESGPKNKKSIFKRIKDIYNKIVSRVKSFLDRLKELADKRNRLLKEINDSDNREAVSFSLGIVRKLLRHILPRKHRIYVRFGTGDPATTGQILGAAYAVGALLGLNLVIEPDFEQKVIECDIPFKGHISLIRVLVWAVQVYRNKKVRKLIGKFNR